jgi:hypothetical protein
MNKLILLLAMIPVLSSAPSGFDLAGPGEQVEPCIARLPSTTIGAHSSRNLDLL